MAKDAWHEVEDAARTVSRAGWWLDHRHPGYLPELLESTTD
ncbi:hypothetical protein [Streptomyces sp. PRh5]|nr:hypothetical protein [Streptomyces sp. PRh5]